jgi:L-asparaginase II
MYDLAYAFARLMAPDESIPAPYPSAAAGVREAMMAHPYLVAGRDRLDTDLMRAAPGALVSKVGAGGVQCVGLRGGLGVAVKMESGGAGTSSAPPAGVAALDVLRQLRVLDAADLSALEMHASPRVTTVAGDPAGVVRATFDLCRGIPG